MCQRCGIEKRADGLVIHHDHASHGPVKTSEIDHRRCGRPRRDACSRIRHYARYCLQSFTDVGVIFSFQLFLGDDADIRWYIGKCFFRLGRRSSSAWAFLGGSWAKDGAASRVASTAAEIFTLFIFFLSPFFSSVLRKILSVLPLCIFRENNIIKHVHAPARQDEK